VTGETIEQSNKCSFEQCGEQFFRKAVDKRNQERSDVRSCVRVVMKVVDTQNQRLIRRIQCNLGAVAIAGIVAGTLAYTIAVVGLALPLPWLEWRKASLAKVLAAAVVGMVLPPRGFG